MSDIALPARFEFVRRLGEGGMGVVYEVRDREHDARVALKTLRRFTAEGLVRFKREFRALHDLQHPNLVNLGELFSEGGEWYFTMELVEGVDFLAHVRPLLRTRVPRSIETAATVSRNGSDGAALALPAAAAHDGVAGALDEAALRACLPQLARALIAVHGANKVHRDVKPSNIRVTRDGRVVLLDFGLVGDIVRSVDSTDANMLGTPAYMAPEQAVSSSVGAAADWYSVGVVLYEALTGTLPFDGAPIQMLVNKQQREPTPPNDRALGLPEDLVRLCMDLLRVDPRSRAGGADVLKRLEAGARQSSRPPPASISVAEFPVFIGRARELAELEAALEEASAGRASAVVIDGESGVGKSALTRKFTDDVARGRDGAIVLTGRCYEREAMPYKAFDGIIDALTRRLSKLPAAESAALLPLRPHALTQIFPALRRIEAFARVAAGKDDAIDPHELRRRAFDALRELFARIAIQRTAPILIIEDMQWVDADSLALLSELLRPPDAPPMLLIVTARTPAQATEATSRIRSIIPRILAALPPPVRTLTLERLPNDEARALASELLARLGAEARGDPRSIAEDAAGHPLFIDELVRHAAHGGGARKATRLDEAIGARVARVSPPASRVLDVVALAEAPLAQEIVARAARMELGELRGATAELRVANLVRTGGARARDTIEPYHDRVRQAVIARLTADARATLHEALALALEGAASDEHEALSMHWSGAARNERAAHHAVLAAEQAERALAFDRAAQWYRRALDLGHEGDERRAILARLGDALANAGRGAAASEEYERAAEGAKAADVLDLRRRAAEQLLRSGRFDRGVAAIRAVLASVGIKLPQTRFGAIASILFWRTILFLRGLAFRERDATQVPAEELMRIDACSAAVVGLSLVDVVYGAAFQTRHLILALRAGEPTRIVRALAHEVGHRGSEGPTSWKRTQEIIDAATPLAERSGDAYARGWLGVNIGIARFCVGDFAKSLVACDEIATVLLEKCAGAAWEIDIARQFAVQSLFYLGKLRELGARVPAYLRDARARGDLYGVVTLSTGDGAHAQLIAGDAAGARRAVGDAMSEWSKQGFHLEHYYELYALTSVDLYEGRGEEALARIDQRWGALTRSMLMRSQFVRVTMRMCRARAAIAAMRGASTKRRRELGARVLADARHVERERAPWATPLAKLASSGARATLGNREGALEDLERARDGFARAEMSIYEALSRRATATLRGDEEAIRAIDAVLAAETVRDAVSFARMLAPGFDGG